MAPKKKAEKAKAQAAQEARRESKKRSAADSCIDEAEERSRPQEKKQRTELTIEQDTLKALKDNFKGFSDFQLRHVLNKDGLSVYDRLFQRKTDKILSPRICCGKNFYAELKHFFGEWITNWIPRCTSN